jgi:hypothetical protein
MLEGPDGLPAMLGELLDGPLGDAIDDRARGTVDDMLAPRHSSACWTGPLSPLPASAPPPLTGEGRRGRALSRVRR